MGNPEEVSFLLQESGLSLVDAIDVLQAADPSLAEKTPYLPKGTTKAHEWMVRNGDPTQHTESALHMAALVGQVKELKVTKNPEAATVTLEYFNRVAEAKAESIPLAICAATLLSLDRKTWRRK